MDSKELAVRYDQIAEWWDNVTRKSNSGFKFIKRSLSLISQKSKALDIGCGSGRFFEMLKNDFQIVGIDVSTEMIKIARERFPHITLINEDFYAWNSQKKFDLVIAWDSIFHAPLKLQEPITRKMCNLLNEGGILLFTVGGINGEVDGMMKSVKFEYASLDYWHYLKIIDEMNCKLILMDRDQYPTDHIVFICQKLKEDSKLHEVSA